MDGKSKKQAALDAEHSENMAKHAADLRPGLFNRVEVGRIGRQINETGSRSLNLLPHSRDLMRG